MFSETATCVGEPPNMGPHTINFVGVDLFVPLLTDPLPLFVADSPMFLGEFSCQDLICAVAIAVNNCPRVQKGTGKPAKFCSRWWAFLPHFPIVQLGHDLQNEAATKFPLHCPHHVR